MPPTRRARSVRSMGAWLVSCSAALAALARVWIPSPSALLADAREVHAHAVLAARSAVRPLAFEDDPNPEEAVSGLLDSVQARFGDAALDLGRVLRRRWMGRKIAFQAVPP